jgi:hypothetical protein
MVDGKAFPLVFRKKDLMAAQGGQGWSRLKNGLTGLDRV